jgi:parallel beta-helix repeat protein/predicted outer membrane repeat protein
MDMKRINFSAVLVMTLASVVLCTPFAGAATLEVGEGKAYSTIQAGIDASVDGDTVLVYPGTYGEIINYNGKAITIKSVSGRAVTAITGPGAGYNATAITFNHNENTGSVLMGFTIGNGFATSVSCSSSSPTISNCTISGNTSYGIYCTSSSSPIITNCTISGNSAQSSGAGIYCNSSSPAITSCTISGNSASGLGGGISCSNSSPTISGCIISGNYAGGGAGGIYCNSSSPAITNCFITGNIAGSYGGGMFCASGSSPAVTNCTFSRNIAYSGGGAIYCNGSSPTIKNCILWGDSASGYYEIYPANLAYVTYSDVYGGYTGTGNIFSDPKFDSNGNYHLSVTSPCINAGTSAGAPATDIDGEARPQPRPFSQQFGIDMGADEYLDTDGDLVQDFRDNCPYLSNQTQIDYDIDRVGDACDSCPHDPNKTAPGSCGCGAADMDADGDGILDCMDNCPAVNNPDQADADSNGIGDACDTAYWKNSYQQSQGNLQTCQSLYDQSQEALQQKDTELQDCKDSYQQTQSALDTCQTDLQTCRNPVTRIALSALTATPSDEKVTLTWKTETEIDNAGFNIWRAEGFVKVNDAVIPALGSAVSGSEYDFVDQWVLNGKRYFYLLEDIDSSGISTFHGPIKATPRWLYGIGK